MNEEISSSDQIKLPTKGISTKSVAVALIILVIGAITLRIGINGYNKTSYDHPIAQFRYVKLLLCGGFFVLCAGVYFLTLVRRLVLGVPALVVTDRGISYRGLRGPWRSAEWNSLGPAEVVIIGTKGRGDYIQAKVTGTGIKGTIESNGCFKVPTSLFNDSASVIAKFVNEVRAQATGDWVGVTPSVETLPDPAEAAADARMARALARRRWALWFVGGAFPILFVAMAIEKDTSLQMQRVLALGALLFGAMVAYCMTWDASRRN